MHLQRVSLWLILVYRIVRKSFIPSGTFEPNSRLFGSNPPRLSGAAWRLVSGSRTEFSFLRNHQVKNFNLPLPPRHNDTVAVTQATFFKSEVECYCLKSIICKWGSQLIHGSIFRFSSETLFSPHQPKVYH